MNKLVISVAATLLAVNVYAATGTTPAATATTAVVQPAEAASTITAPVTAVAPLLKKITVNYTAETTAAAEGADHNNWDGATASLQHVGLKYDLGNDKAVQFRQYFSYNLTDAKKTDEWGMGQSMFRYIDNKQLELGNITVAGDTRFYIPGAEFERKVGQYVLRHDASVEKAMGKATLSAAISARVYAYAQKADGEIGGRVLPALGVEYAVNSVLSPYVTVFTDNRWYNTGKGVAPLGPQAGVVKDYDANRDFFATDIGSKIKVSKNLAFDAYVETYDNLRDNVGYDLFDSANNTYEIDMTVSL